MRANVATYAVLFAGLSRADGELGARGGLRLIRGVVEPCTWPNVGTLDPSFAF